MTASPATRMSCSRHPAVIQHATRVASIEKCTERKRGRWRAPPRLTEYPLHSMPDSAILPSTHENRKRSGLSMVLPTITMSFIKQIKRVMTKGFAFLVLCFVAFAHSATVDVDLDIQTSIVASDVQRQVKNVAIFVLDRSGSMIDNKMRNASGKLPNDLLTDSVRDRARVLAKTAPGTQVYLLPFSGSIGKLEGPFQVGDEAGLRKLETWDGFDARNCGGITLLYDTLAYSLDFAEELIQNDQNVKVQIYGYTDGGNFTGTGDKVVNENFGNVRKVKVRYPTIHEGNRRETDAAYNLFYSQYGDKIKQFIIAGRMGDDIQWRWLGAGEPPKGVGNVRKDEYKLSFSSTNPVLKNPSVALRQALQTALVIPIPQQYVGDLANLRAKLSLELMGRKAGSTVIRLAPGRQTVSLQLPDNIGDGETTGILRLMDIPDAWDRLVLKAPQPLEIKFAAPGVLALTLVEPDGEAFVRAGDKVRFSAKATESADVTWMLDREPIGRSDFTKVFDSAAEHKATAIAKKEGFRPATNSVTVHVLETGVAVRLTTQKPMVGDPVSIEAHAKGHPVSYFWWIDEQPVQGDNAKLTVTSFDRSGRHVAKVRASYGHGIFAESAVLPFDVAVQPRVTIEDPVSGSEFEFGQKIECNANVEGDFDKVVWNLSGPVEDTREAVVDKGQRISKPAFFTPSKGGQFVLTAMAQGASGSLAATTEVKFTVAREDIGIAIQSPASGTVIQLGPDARNPDMMAAVKGDAIKRVRWTMLNQRTGETKELRVTPVQSGVATCACPSDATIGDEVSLMIQAEAVFDVDGAEKVASPAIELITRLNASLDIDAKVDGGEANGRDVTFGKQIELSAICGGCVSPADIQWFAETDGNERSIGAGPKCMAPKEEPNGESLRTVRYFAKAKLPDGTFKESRKVSVFHSCGCLNLKASIKLPKGSDGITRITFGRGEPIRAEIESSGDAELTDVVWDMGGLASPTGPVAECKFGKYGEYTISATGKCKDCGKAYALEAVQVKIEQQPMRASFTITPDKNTFDIKSTIKLKDSSSGDVDRCVWTTNGVEFARCGHGESVELSLPGHSCEMAIGMRTENDLGETSEAQPRTIRVRYGGWLIGAFVFLALLILLPFVKLLLGNGPAGWRIVMWKGPVPKPGPKGDEDERKAWAANRDFYRPIPRKRWSLRDKQASIPPPELGIDLEDMGGLPPKDGNLIVGSIAPKAGGLLALVPDGNADRALLGEPGVEYYRWFASSDIQQRDLKKGRPLRCLRVVLDTNHRAYLYAVALWILTAVLLAVVIWASFKFAI